MNDRHQHVAKLKEAIEQNEMILAQMKRLLNDLEGRRTESEQRHGTGLPTIDHSRTERQKRRN